MDSRSAARHPLSPRTLQARRRLRLGPSPIRSSGPPVRIVGSVSRYRGGYCL